MRSKLALLAALLTLASGCAYRYTDYTLHFSDTRTGLPPKAQQIVIYFPSELFPAPQPIRTNLDEQGAVALRLPDRFAWLSLHGAVHAFFFLDLHANRRDSRSTFSLSDNRTGVYKVLLMKTGETK